MTRDGVDSFPTPPPLLTMGSSCVWILFVDHRFQAIGPCFQVDTASVDIVESLKEMARDKRPIAFFRADANPADCTVWRTKGDLIINSSTIDNLEQILRSIDECDEKTIEDLVEDDEVESLQLSDGEVLLLQMPGMPRIFISTTIFSYKP